jgi:hypothetical protein
MKTALASGTVPHFLPGKSPLPGLDPKLTDRFGRRSSLDWAVRPRCFLNTS